MSDGFPQIMGIDGFALDTEDTGLQFWNDELFGFSIACDLGKWYFDIRREPNALLWLQDLCNSTKEIAFHNSKFDMHMLREAGVIIDPTKAHCTVIGAALIDEHLREYSLDYVGKKYVKQGKTEGIYQALANIFGGKPTKDAQIGNLPNAPFDLAARYATDDAEITWKLRNYQRPVIGEQSLTRVYEIERKLTPVLMRMELGGVRVDEGAAHHAVRELERTIKVDQRALNKICGFDVNVNSNPQMHRIFQPKLEGKRWFALDGTPLETTDGGRASLNKAALEAITHPAANMINGLRELIKTKDTFLLGHVLGHKDKNNYVHANFNQTKSDGGLGTGTGRLSCNDPALQQIHKRNAKIAAIVRAVFLPDEGQDWDCHDWSQMDFRIFSHYVKDPRVLKMYADDPKADYHGMVATMTGLPRKQTPGVKGNAKQINLGLVFGMGSGKLAKEMGLPFEYKMVHFEDDGYDEQGNPIEREIMTAGEDAMEVFDKYHHNLPRTKPFLNKAASIARTRGHVLTTLKRRIRFPFKSYYKAGGLIFQGTAADCLKIKMIEVDEALQGTGGRLMLNVHDELDSSLPKGSDGKKLSAIITERMEAFGPGDEIELCVPIRTSVGVGQNWWEASKE